MPTRRLGRAGLEVTTLGFGGGALGGLYEPVPAAQAEAAVAAAWERGIRYFDTAPLYGHGRSERRLGAALRGVPRERYVLATKVGVAIAPDERDAAAAERRYADPWVVDGRYDFGYDACLRSLEASMERLGVDRVDVVNVHDPDEGDSALPPAQRRGIDHLPEVMDGAYRALHELREQGVVRAIGVGMNGVEPLAAFARAGEFDCFLLAGRYTLLEQRGLEDLLPLCEARGIALVIGGVFNSGILASGSGAATPRYDYAPAEEATIARVRAIEALAERHGVTLPAAALQFPLGHPAVATAIPGMRSVGEVDANVAAARQEIPAAFWSELHAERLVDARAPLPSAGV
ncbi:MAG: aldo/keto reductase [Actinobacteria bacterium]|nr:aldo/keto reductase [Actinomycetota bacterium]